MNARFLAGDGVNAARIRSRRFRWVLLVAMAALLALVSGGGLDGGKTAAQAPPPGGQWSAPITWPTTGIHGGVLPDGRVMHFAYPLGGPFASVGRIWNPVTGVFQSATASYNLFCGGHAFLPDGTLITLGGTHQDSPVEGNPWGHRRIHQFNYSTNTFAYTSDTQAGRWYPTTTELPDGRILISSGYDGAGALNNRLEIYDPVNGSQYMPASSDIFLPLYPWMHVLPNGKVFDSGPQDVGVHLDLTTSAWAGVDYNNYGSRYDGTSVLLPLEAPAYNPEVMIIGGDNPATNTTERIDLGAAVPAFVYADSMTHARHHANAVLLPDGKVGIFGGTSLLNEPAQAVYAAEIYDPATDTWTEMASNQRPRIYHSTAILLPDGRVLASGTDGEFTSEIYSPPYLFAGPRPTVTQSPGAVAHSANFLVTTPNAADIQKVMLIKNTTVTHSVNMEQRAIELDFEVGPGALRIGAPPNPNIAPPGFYMLFLVDANGVPSVASMIRIGATTDSDGDGLSDGSETSLHLTNPMAADTDLDGLSDGAELFTHNTDPLDPDVDGDGLNDGEEINIYITDPLVADTDTDFLNDGLEVACGSIPTEVLSQPERIDGQFAGADDDGDLSVDEPLPQGAGGSDCDRDGYDGGVEASIYYPGLPGDQDPCGGSAVPAGDSGWPSDFVSGGVPLSTNRVTITDLSSYIAPVRRLNTSPPQAAFNARWDLAPGKGLFADWIAINDLTTLLAGDSGFPPMLGGVRAFNGPVCPWAP
jgi:hypothetical protein